MEQRLEKKKENINPKTDLISNSVNNVLSSLDVEWRAVITLRFGLNGESPKSVEEVAEILGTTKEAIISLEKNALRFFYTRKKY